MLNSKLFQNHPFHKIIWDFITKALISCCNEITIINTYFCIELLINFKDLFHMINVCEINNCISHLIFLKLLFVSTSVYVWNGKRCHAILENVIVYKNSINVCTSRNKSWINQIYSMNFTAFLNYWNWLSNVEIYFICKSKILYIKKSLSIRKTKTK